MSAHLSYLWIAGATIKDVPALEGLVRRCITAMRAAADFRLVGFFKRIRHTHFARLDTAVYSPLCLALAIGSAIISFTAQA